MSLMMIRIGFEFKVICKEKIKGEKNWRSAVFETVPTPIADSKATNNVFSYKCDCGKLFSSKNGMSLPKLISHTKAKHAVQDAGLRGSLFASFANVGRSNAAIAAAKDAKKLEDEEVAETLRASEEEERKKRAEEDGDDADGDGCAWEDMEDDEEEKELGAEELGAEEEEPHLFVPRHSLCAGACLPVDIAAFPLMDVARNREKYGFEVSTASVMHSARCSGRVSDGEAVCSTCASLPSSEKVLNLVASGKLANVKHISTFRLSLNQCAKFRNDTGKAKKALNSKSVRSGIKTARLLDRTARYQRVS
jgi:hypothetical protein